MKTRKLLAVLLSLALAIGLMAPAAMAEEEKVAKAGDEEYATLADAISAAAPNSTVTLLKNASGAGVVINKNITIDFGGNTYSFTSGVGSTGTTTNGFQILKDNTVTLKNGTLNVASGSADKFYILVQNYADLTVTDMTLDGTYLDKWSFTDGDSYVLSNNCGNVTVNGETNIIANNDGDLAFAFDSCDKSASGYSIPNVTVNTSGTIDGNIEVTGGNLTIQKGSFTDLSTAVAYAAEGAVITLAEDAAGSGVVIDKDITIDFGGNTYSFTSGVGSTGTTTNGFQILKDNTVTLKNGTLNVASGSADKFYILVQNYADLTVTDMTLDGTYLDKWSFTDGDSYVLSNNCGNVTVNGETNIIANNDGDLAFAFDSCDKSASGYSIPNVTVNTSGMIDGNIEVTGGNLTIKGGSFICDPTAYVADGYIVMKDGADYNVVAKSNLTAGTYMADPTGATATNYYVTNNNDGTWTVAYRAPSSGGGGGSSSSSTTTTEKNPDGSTTTTTTNKTTGTVTETTKTTDGVTVTTTTDKAGDVTSVTANVPAAAAKEADKAGEPVTLPIEVQAGNNSAEATEIKVNVPSTGATVEIPVENVTPGTVVIIVNADGTESIVPLTTLTEDGVVVTLEDDATIKVVDNSKDFVDVPDEYALADSIDFVSARGLFEGTTETTFNPHANTTIAQTMTVLARLSGEDFYGAGSTTKGAEWATEKGLSDGTDVSKAITREQMVVMMWKLAGMPESDQVLTASDVNDISADALVAMQWAVEMGILKGNLDGTINPQGNASRAHVAAFTERYVNALAN